MIPAFLCSVAHTMRALLHRRAADRELDDELRFHLDMQVALYIRQGMGPFEARRAALLAFGGVQRYREQYRAERGARRIERMVQDLRYAARRLRREPGFTLPVVSALGVGIGATVAVFTLADAVLFRPLPYPNADRLVVVGHRGSSDAGVESGQSESTYLHYLANNRSFEHFGIYFDRDLSLTDGKDPERVVGALVTPGVFEALGVPAMVGSVCPRWTESNKAPDGIARIVLGNSLWRSRYGADPDVIGRQIEINRGPRTIVGIMPPNFHFPRLETQLWFCNDIDMAQPESESYRTGVAVLKQGITSRDAEADIQRLMMTLGDAFPAAAAEIAAAGTARAVVTPLRDVITRDVRPALVLLACTAGFVLLIAWANAVNLVLVRGERQRRQIAVERALGASTSDVAQRHLCEALLLAVGAGMIAWTVARLAIAWHFGFSPGEVPRLHELRADARAALLMTGLITTTALLIGAAAFARTGGTSVLAALRGGAGRARSGPEWRRMQHSLVVVQVALALTLLIASGVMVQSYWRLSRFALGFDASSTLTIEVPLPYRGYSRYDDGARLFDEVLSRVRALPGVISAEAASGRLPLTPLGEYGYTNVGVSDGPDATDAAPIRAAMAIVTPGWFDAMRIPLRHGRAFRPGDLVNPSHPIIVSAALARAAYGSEDVIGRRLLDPGQSDAGRPYTIVGVVGNVPGDRIPDGPSRTIYFPVLRDLALTPDSAPPVPFYPGEMTLFVRTGGAPATLVAPIRRIIGALDPHVPVTNPRTLEDIVRGSTGRARLTMLLLIISACVALLLGVIGIYGVVSYSVSQRTPEIGIRMALGATPSSVNTMVLCEGAAMTAVGITAGVMASLLVTRLLRGLVFGVSATEPMTFVAMVVLLFGIALAASYLPARRAAGIDPVQALRAE